MIGEMYMGKIGIMAEKILEELSDGNIHIRNDMLNNQKRILRKNEDPNIEFNLILLYHD